MEGYKYLLAGWVGNVSVHAVTRGDSDDKMIIMAKVRHSQSVTAPPLQPWVLLKSVAQLYALIAHVWLAWAKHALILQPFCLLLRHTIALRRMYHARLSLVPGFLQTFEV